MQEIYQVQNVHQVRETNQERKNIRRQTKNINGLTLKHERTMFIALDGMDQAKTDTPSFVRDTAQTAKVPRLTVSLVGVLIHGHSPGALVFAVPSN